MDSKTLSTVALIAAVATVAPLLSEASGRKVPSVVLELLAGIVIGPHVLAIATETPTVNSLATFGLSFLFFMAGYEIEFAQIKGRPLKLAGIGWFDEDDAIKFKEGLDKEGYDTIVRPAAAYSTGGWFPDPVLSSMLGGGVAITITVVTVCRCTARGRIPTHGSVAAGHQVPRAGALLRPPGRARWDRPHRAPRFHRGPGRSERLR